MNIEKKHSARRELLCPTVFFIKMTEQSETTLRNSAVRYSIFCGSLFNPRPIMSKKNSCFHSILRSLDNH